MYHEIWYIQKFEKTQVRSTCVLRQNDLNFGAITILVIIGIILPLKYQSLVRKVWKIDPGFWR